MDKAAAPTLSAHLLEEATKFLFYPQRQRRTRKNLQVQEYLEERLRVLVAWRKTFAPKTVPVDLFSQEGPMGLGLLDQLYCRERLREVPALVERTRKLAPLTLAGVSGEGFVYLRESASCYVAGLPQASVALARAAIEVTLREAAAGQFGASAVAKTGLFELIDDLAKRGRLLSVEHAGLAHQVRLAADKVLHEAPTTDDDALAVVEAARRVVLGLAKKVR